MPRYPKDINAIYISQRLREELGHIGHCALTTVTAPMGYGKTTAALWYLAERQKKGDPVFRVNIYSSDVSLFWQSFRSAFRGTELGDRLQGMDFPTGKTAVDMLIHAMADYLDALEGDMFLLIDDCHLMEDRRVSDMLFSLCDLPTDKLHLIAISRGILFQQGEELHLGSRLHQIDADDLRLDRSELAAYLRRCGIDLPDRDFETLYQNSEGWISCVYLNLRNYERSGALLSRGEDIYAMIGDALYAGYGPNERRFLLDLCLADEFTADQAAAITDAPDALQILRSLAQNNAFIRYLPDTQTYRFHHMLRDYAQRLAAQLPAQHQDALRLRYGQWHEAQGQYLQAIRFYSDAASMPGALRVIGLDRGVQLASIDPQVILALLDRCTEAELMAEPQALLVLMRRLFSWRQIPRMLQLKELLLRSAHRPGLDERERDDLLGECDLVMSFLGYNDIAAMSALHQKAASLMKRSTISTGNTGSYTFGSPSVLMMFHREPGKLADEVAIMHRAMPFYYQITDHHGQGAELVMEAEALYHRGQFTDSKIILQRAKEACESTQQLYLPLSCGFLERRLALFGELPREADWYQKKTAAYRKANDPMIFSTLDGCAAYLAAVEGQPEQIPAWIAQGRLDSANLLGPARPMFEVICSQALLAQRDYIAVAARGEKLLAMCGAFPYLLCQIHVYIQLAVANDALGKAAEATGHLRQALDLALPDGIIMPFAENPRLCPLLEGFRHIPEVVRILRLQERLRLPQSPDSLTEREKTVAALYASGKTRRQIAEALFLSEGTVKNHISQIYDKLHLTGSPKQKQHALAQLVQKDLQKM